VWLAGVALYLVGSVTINLGTNLMKLGYNRRAQAAAQAAATAKSPTPNANPAWRAGALVFGLGNVLNFVSFGFAAQSLLAAIGSAQFVSNAVFSRVVLGERPARPTASYLATGVIVAGCCLLVAFGSHASRSYTVPELLACYADPAYVAYVVIGSCVGLACYWGYRRGRRFLAAGGGGAGGGDGALDGKAAALKKQQQQAATTTTIDHEDAVLLGDPRLLEGGGGGLAGLGGLGGLGGLFSSPSSAATQHPQQQEGAGAGGGTPSSGGLLATRPFRALEAAFRRRRPSPEQTAAAVATLLPALFATFSALVGTQSVLFSKTLAVLLRALSARGGGHHNDDAEEEGEFSARYLPFLLAVPVLFLAAAAFWVARLNQGLRLFPSSSIVPAMQVAWTLLSVLSGLLHFGEYRDMSAGAAAGFCCGVATVLLGVVMLSRAGGAVAAEGGAGASSPTPGALCSSSPASLAAGVVRSGSPKASRQASSPTCDITTAGGAALAAAQKRKLALVGEEEEGGEGGAGGGGGRIAAVRTEGDAQPLLAGAGPESNSGGGGGGGSDGGSRRPLLQTQASAGTAPAAAGGWLSRARSMTAPERASAARQVWKGFGDASLLSVFMPPLLYTTAVEAVLGGGADEDGGSGGGGSGGERGGNGGGEHPARAHSSPPGAAAAAAAAPPVALVPLASGAELGIGSSGGVAR
jgi:hypothetical protein